MDRMIRWGAMTLAVLCLAVTLTRSAVGPTPGADGTYGLLSPRVDKTGAAVVASYGGGYGEASLRQLTFCACDQGTGITPTTSLSTTSMIVLYNPSGNNQRFRLQSVSLSYVSGTLSSATPPGPSAMPRGWPGTSSSTSISGPSAAAP